MEVRKRNHYISQMILKGWAFEEDLVYLYSLDTSNFSYQKRNIKSVACTDEIYVMNKNGELDDSYEVWMAEEIESPASRALDRARKGEELKKGDWDKLCRLMALQYVRSPKYTEKYKGDLWDKNTYLHTMKKNLEEVTEIFQNQKWSVMDVDKRVSIPLSDNCVVSVSLENIDSPLDAEFGDPQTMVLFPISPTKVLYYLSGKFSNNFISSRGYGNWIKELICQNASNMVLSNKIDYSLEEYLPKKEKQFVKSE